MMMMMEDLLDLELMDWRLFWEGKGFHRVEYKLHHRVVVMDLHYEPIHHH